MHENFRSKICQNLKFSKYFHKTVLFVSRDADKHHVKYSWECKIKSFLLNSSSYRFSSRNSWQGNIGPAIITTIKHHFSPCVCVCFSSAVCEPAAPGRRSTGCQAILHHPGRVVRKISRNASKYVFSVGTKLEKKFFRKRSITSVDLKDYMYVQRSLKNVR